MSEAEDVPNSPPESTAATVEPGAAGPNPAAAEPGAAAPTASASAAAESPALDAEGRERPRFLLEFPNDPALQQLVSAFEAGNYRAVREGSAKLVASTEDPIVRAAARELARRIEPDPLMKYLLFVALGLFVFVVWYTYQGQP